jgi:hypothetical protein
MQQLRASRPWPDEVSHFFTVKSQFHEGSDLNGFSGAELARVQLFERGDGGLYFRDCP